MQRETDLLEREQQIGELSADLDAARAGHGRVVLVHGEAGIGKTALLTHFARRQAKSPVRLFWGGCDPLSTPRPLSPLLDIAWLHGGSLAERIVQGATRDAIFQAFFEELRHPRPPAIVVIEDVHWADEATLDLLKFLGRRAERTSALLVVTWRDDELAAGRPLHAAIGDLPRSEVRRIWLPGLSPAAVEALCRKAKKSIAGLHAATNGNPFFVTEALSSDGAGVPPTVRDALLARAARLSPPARELCELASVAPARVELPVLERAAGPSFAALDELLAAGMLSAAEGAVAFRHELARRAIEDALPLLRARDLHARILEALRSHGEEPSRLARILHHAAGAGDSTLVLRLAPAAAEYAAALGAHREAAAHLAAALRHAADLQPRRRAELLEARSYQCYLTDRMQDAIQARSEARDLWRDLGDRTREGECLRWLSRMSWFSARGGEARSYGALAVEALGALPPGRELAMAWSNQSCLHMLASESAPAIAWGEKALELSRARGYPDIEAHALHNVGFARVQGGEGEGWALLEQSLRISLEHGLEEHAARAYANLGNLSVQERRYREARRWLDAGADYAGERDLGVFKLCALAWRARLLAEEGIWAGAADDAAHVLDDPRGSPVVRLAALGALGLVRARRGDPGAWEALDEALQLARRSDEPQWLVPVAAARAELAWLSGDGPRTLAEAAAVIDRVRRARVPWYTGDLALWIWRGGGSPPPAAECARPIALQLQGEWRAASEEFERLGCPYQAALACYEGADPKALLRALETLERLEARPAAARLRRRLAELGVRGVPRGPRPARRDNPFDLTAREQEVLAAVAAGLSNGEIGARLFVSPKTVDHHVSAILAKLGVRSRAAAAAEAHRRGLLTRDADAE